MGQFSLYLCPVMPDYLDARYVIAIYPEQVIQFTQPPFVEDKTEQVFDSTDVLTSRYHVFQGSFILTNPIEVTGQVVLLENKHAKADYHVVSSGNTLCPLDTLNNNI